MMQTRLQNTVLWRYVGHESVVERGSSFPIINCENITEEGENKTSEVLLYDPFFSRKVEDEVL